MHIKIKKDKNNRKEEMKILRQEIKNLFLLFFRYNNKLPIISTLLINSLPFNP